jgi:hypothetical protein
LILADHLWVGTPDGQIRDGLGSDLLDSDSGPAIVRRDDDIADLSLRRQTIAGPLNENNI